MEPKRTVIRFPFDDDRDDTPQTVVDGGKTHALDAATDTILSTLSEASTVSRTRISEAQTSPRPFIPAGPTQKVLQRGGVTDAPPRNQSGTSDPHHDAPVSDPFKASHQHHGAPVSDPFKASHQHHGAPVSDPFQASHQHHGAPASDPFVQSDGQYNFKRTDTPVQSFREDQENDSCDVWASHSSDAKSSEIGVDNKRQIEGCRGSSESNFLSSTLLDNVDITANMKMTPSIAHDENVFQPALLEDVGPSSLDQPGGLSFKSTSGVTVSGLTPRYESGSGIRCLAPGYSAEDSNQGRVTQNRAFRALLFSTFFTAKQKCEWLRDWITLSQGEKKDINAIIETILTFLTIMPFQEAVGFFALKQLFLCHPSAVVEAFTTSKRTLLRLFPSRGTDAYGADFLLLLLTYTAVYVGGKTERKVTRILLLLCQKRARVTSLSDIPVSDLRNWVCRVWLDIPSSRPSSPKMMQVALRWINQDAATLEQKEPVFHLLLAEMFQLGVPGRGETEMLLHLFTLIKEFHGRCSHDLQHVASLIRPDRLSAVVSAVLHYSIFNTPLAALSLWRYLCIYAWGPVSPPPFLTVLVGQTSPKRPWAPFYDLMSGYLNSCYNQGTHSEAHNTSIPKTLKQIAYSSVVEQAFHVIAAKLMSPLNALNGMQLLIHLLLTGAYPFTRHKDAYDYVQSLIPFFERLKFLWSSTRSVSYALTTVLVQLLQVLRALSEPNEGKRDQKSCMSGDTPQNAFQHCLQHNALKKAQKSLSRRVLDNSNESKKTLVRSAYVAEQHFALTNAADMQKYYYRQEQRGPTVHEQKKLQCLDSGSSTVQRLGEDQRFIPWSLPLKYVRYALPCVVTRKSLSESLLCRPASKKGSSRAVKSEVRKPLSESGKTNEQEAEHQNSTASFPSNQVAEQPTNNAKKACSRVDLKQKTQISETFQVKAEDNAVKPLMKNVPLDTTTQHEFTNKIPVLTADDHRRRTDQEIQDSKPRQPNVWQQCYPVTCTPLCHVPKEQQLRGTQPTWLMNPLYQYQYGNPFFPYERQNFFDFNPRLCFDDSDVAWPIAPQAKPLDWEAQHNFSSDPRIGEALGYPPVPFGTPTLMGVEEETVRQQQTYLALGASAPSGVRLKLRQRFVGLQNLGNTCYLNSVLQSLFLSTAFVANLFRFRMRQNRGIELSVSGRSQRFLFELQLLMAGMLLEKRRGGTASLCPSRLLKTLPSFFRRGEQQDATEAARYIFAELGGNNEKLVELIFTGLVVVKTECLSCGHTSCRPERVSDFGLPVPTEETFRRRKSIDKRYQVTVQLLFEEYVLPEYLKDDNAYACERCSKRVTARRWTEIQSPPAHLFVVLHCFSWDPEAKVHRKEATPVDIDVSIRVWGLVYTLYSVIVHKGRTVSSGHYFTVGRRSEWISSSDKKPIVWRRFDDSTVVPEHNCVNPATQYWSVSAAEDSPSASDLARPYILFYRCVEAPPSPPIIVPPQIVKKCRRKFRRDGSI